MFCAARTQFSTCPVVRYRFRGQTVPGSKPDSTEDPQCMWAWWALNLTSLIKLSLARLISKLLEGDEMLVKVSSSLFLTTIQNNEVPVKIPSC
ncbi:hypothetical protein AVEN_6997-1 [Araneus ventricosus]|uniref:Uncharacterized protein n=1 Tax=Araneus ventricosus TaxID=182803 RepID=A0A4Y2JNC6_ARAVE|nr:hypothetical protein AVEN_6997-1 [Araneus ventricosus]